MIKLLTTGCLVFFFMQFISAQSTSIHDPKVHASAINVDDLKSYLYVLASDSLEGRETGTIGNDKAAAFISKTLKNSGVEFLPQIGSYLQPVLLRSYSWDQNELTIRGRNFRHLFDFLSFPAQGSKANINTKEVVFLGYGIEDAAWNDYKDVNVKDKVILIYDGEPKDQNGNFRISRDTNRSKWSADPMSKLKRANEAGASCVLIIKDNIQNYFFQNRSKIVGGQFAPEKLNSRSLENIAHAYISTDMLSALLGKRQKKFIKNRDKGFNQGVPFIMKLKTDIQINQNPKIKQLQSNNIVGFIEGSDPKLKEEYVIFSCHMDHLGKRENVIFYGADDDGSGTSAVMMISKAFAKAKANGHGPKRSMLFCFFTGEEKGLLGSDYFTTFPPIPLSQMVVDLNIDMVGRRDKKYADNPNFVYLIGSDKLSTELHEISESTNTANENLIFDYTYNNDKDPNRYYYRSDHYNFAKNNIPVIFYFNGTHEDYHRPTDTVDKIEFEKIEKISRAVFFTAWELANRSERIVVDKKK